MNIAHLATAIMILVLTTNFGASAQDSNLPDTKIEQSSTKSADAKPAVDSKSAAATQAFNEMKKLIAHGKWEDAVKHMTKKAENELVIEQVMTSVAMTEMEFPVPVPELEDLAEEIDDVLKKYGLDKLELDSSKMFKMKMSFDGDEEDESDEADHDDEVSGVGMPDSGTKIMAAVEKDGKKWQIVKDLWNAKKSSPFSMSVWTGKITKADADEAHPDTAYLEIVMAPASSEENGGVMVQMMVPPTIVRMKRDGSDWKFDGRDHERTQKAMSKFMEKMQRNQGGFPGDHPPRKDF